MKLKKRDSARQDAAMESRHQKVVDSILSQPLPRRRLPALASWSLWLLASAAGAGMVLLGMGLQPLREALAKDASRLVFLVLEIAGILLASWQAMASSLPGRATGRAYKLTLAVILTALALLPLGFEADPALSGGLSGCAKQVLALGILPWLALGWLLSRNASFSPAGAGAWSGLAAFMIGMVAIQLHCPNWNPSHVLVSHGVPVVFAAGLTVLLGRRWFSRWAR